MRLFIYEHTCAAVRSDNPELAAIHAEGRAMLSAIIDDFRQVPGIDVVTVDDDSEDSFRRAAVGADGTLVIAPEFDGILESRCQWVEQAGGRLLGPSSEAVRLTSDKLTLCEHWQRHGIPTPATRLVATQAGCPGRLGSPPPAGRVWQDATHLVIKLRHGAGAVGTFRVNRFDDIPATIAQARKEGYDGELIFQPWVAGRSVSVSWIIGPKQQIPLVPAEQHLADDGRLHYLGGAVPLDESLADRAVLLSEAAIGSVPGLLGWVGVDLILGEKDDGSQDFAVEINPRLTTSYIGLRALAKMNLAQLMLQVILGQPASPLSWHPARVTFQANGVVSTSSISEIS
jgi:hypothetical protein